MGKVTELRPKTENEIGAYLHCGKCLEDIPPDISPSDYQRLEVGWTEQGIQIWCKRHNLNVMHMDFEGHQHPAK